MLRRLLTFIFIWLYFELMFLNITVSHTVFWEILQLMKYNNDRNSMKYETFINTFTQWYENKLRMKQRLVENLNFK